MYSNYKFKLESILNYRGQLEEMLKKEFSTLQESLLMEETRLVELEEFYGARASEMLSKDEITPAELEVYRGYLTLIKEKIIDARNTLEIIEQKIDKKRDQLMEASKEKKVMEAVKDKGLKEHIRAEAKSEQVVSDEFNVNKFGK
ncbi:MAG: flagellar export protein FliJ [Thermodesulfobacteriota bacterium]